MKQILNILLKIARFPKVVKFQKVRWGFCMSVLHIYKVVITPVILTGIVFMTK